MSMPKKTNLEVTLSLQGADETPDRLILRMRNEYIMDLSTLKFSSGSLTLEDKKTGDRIWSISPASTKEERYEILRKVSFYPIEWNGIRNNTGLKEIPPVTKETGIYLKMFKIDKSPLPLDNLLKIPCKRYDLTNPLDLIKALKENISGSLK